MEQIIKNKEAKIGFRLSVLFIAILSSCIFAAGSSAVSSGSALIGTFLISDQSLYSPYPVEPGKYMDLWLRVQYRGDKVNAENVTCVIETKYPFSFDPGDSAEKEIGTLAPFQEVLLKYKLRVDESAVQGSNKLIFKCKSLSSEWIGTELSFYVQTHEAVLSVERVESNPEKFQPGERGNVNLYIQNLADNTLKDISVKLDLSGTDIPFAPVNSTIEKRIESIGAKNSSILTFNVIALQDATSKTYKIPLTMIYSDDLGRNYTKSTIIALTVQAKQPDILVTQEQTIYIKNEMKNSVTISIVNKGTTQIKFITAELGSGEGYQILSPRQIYVGSIPSDDSETAEYDLFINSSLPQIQLPINITFSDVEGNKYSMQKTVEIKVYSREAALKLGIDKSVVATDPLILGLIAIIAIYIIYRIIKFLFFRKK